MSVPPREREVIDVDEWDIFCTGVRRCIHIDRSPSPPPSRKRRHRPVTIPVLDPDTDDHPMSSASTNPYTELQRITQSELKLRTTLLDTRPAKKRETDAIRLAMNAVNNHNELKRKQRERVPEVIEVSSDSEPENCPPKRHKVDEHNGPHDTDNSTSADPEDIPKLELEFSHAEINSPISSDRAHSDDDDDNCVDFFAALDISNEINWIPLPERNKAEDLTPTNEPDIIGSKPPLSPAPHFPRKRPPVDHRHVPLDWNSIGPWGTLSRNCGITRFPKPFYHARRQDRLTPRHPPSLYYEKGFTKLQLTAKYPHLASGSVNRIIQAQDTAVLCAAVEAGLEDDDDDDDDNDRPPPPPENKVGSLAVHYHGRVHIAPAHCHLRETSRGSVMKYYSVGDVAFNPFNPRQFLSSGYDCAVQAWEILGPDDNDECNGLNAICRLSLDSRPQDLVYAPDESTLAISFHDGTVRLCSQDLFEDMMDEQFSFNKKFYIAPRGSGHAAGSTLWGRGPSKHLLFTSSEPTVREDYGGYHHAFDTCKGVQAVQFDAMEAGDAAALNPDGTTLALFTWGMDSTHPVRLYDVRRKVKEAYETEELEKFQIRPAIGAKHGLDDTEEVTTASFSPDGRLLAVGRNDNALHVYDVRALSRGPLCRFEHHDSDAVGGGGFGIVAARWVQGRDRMGIMTGGNDGCVRLWEPTLGSRDDVQGAVIGRTDFDVAHFSVGDRQSGELPLVIGDSGGGMHTYDFTNEDGIPV